MEKEILDFMRDDLQKLFDKWIARGYIESDHGKNFCGMTWDGFISLQAKTTDKIDDYISESEYNG
jgi:polyhydroxyalkanoate synthesis regulator phasin